MKVIENEKCLFFDCDDTLVMWDSKYIKEDDNGNRNSVLIKDPYSPTASIYELVPHENHVKYLKDSKLLNKNTIVVWSAGGWAWAQAVVEALGLEEYVDAVMEKPTHYVDDLPCTHFMGDRIYKVMK